MQMGLSDHHRSNALFSAILEEMEMHFKNPQTLKISSGLTDLCFTRSKVLRGTQISTTKRTQVGY